ncbi:hypothetical protein HNO88_003921 [Novosphingobium chloroacetimidivorans]|uniref:Uncharacterized protein n=1 Tax=Novosphingobium chloroacetimidivorans TaxID=1428314 RepID=A0A7W7KD11_9SPHN|nr:hypothetical protein [Novosphingobium chloroacetimidivorans]
MGLLPILARHYAPNEVMGIKNPAEFVTYLQFYRRRYGL